MSHVSGPWHVEVYESEPDRPFVCADWGQQDPIVNDFSDIWDTPVIHANATLVAAAPDLLAALQLAESVYRLNVVAPGEPSSVLDALQAAIAKATGT